MTPDTPRPEPGYEADTVEFRTSRCPYCGQHGSVRVTLDDLARRAAGDLIQVAFPEMPAGLREQIVSGTHPDCYDALFAGAEDDDGPAGPPPGPGDDGAERPSS